MKTSIVKMMTVAVLLMAGIGSVKGDVVYTVDNFVSEIGAMNYHGNGFSTSTTFYTFDFTLDGFPNEHVYIVGLSQFPDGQIYLNVAGYNTQEGSSFLLYTFGDNLSNVPVLELYIIIDDGDGELFSIGNDTLNLGLGNDQILSSITISINGGDFGEFSILDYSPGQPATQLTSIAVVTPPVVLTSPENATSGIDPNISLVWEGDAASEFNVSLWDDEGGPVYVFPDLTDTSLDVNGYLDWNTTYNWQVDEVIGGVVTYSSPVWSFETADYECQTVLVGDVNGDCVVNLADIALVAGNWLLDVPKVPKGS